MNLTEYAKHSGRSKATISQWIRPGGILEKAASRHKGIKEVQIDQKIADALLGEFLDPSKIHKQNQSPGVEKYSYKDAATKDKYYAMALKKVKLDMINRTLTLKADEEKEGFECGRQLRDSILSIRERLSAILAAETDEFKIYQILTKELNQALELTIEKLGQEKINEGT